MRDTVSVASVRWSLTIIFVVCMSTSLLVSFQGRSNDNRLEKALVVQSAAVAQINTNTHNLCVASNTAAKGTNAVLGALINAVTLTKSIPPAEKLSRVRKYRDVLVPLLKCPPGGGR